jgi:hypothetical protein
MYGDNYFRMSDERNGDRKKHKKQLHLLQALTGESVGGGRGAIPPLLQSTLEDIDFWP